MTEASPLSHYMAPGHERAGKVGTLAPSTECRMVDPESGKDVGAGRILIRQKVSQGDLAAMAGIARENLSRILQDWMDGKDVSRLAGYYCLERKEALERAADA